MKLLLTAFDAFGKETINPALEAVKLVQSQSEDVQIMKLKVPTVYGKATQIVTQSLEYNSPDAVLCIGQAGGRYGISLEAVALNVEDSSISDNEGNQRYGKLIVENGPVGYRTTVDVFTIQKDLEKSNIPTHISYHAGTFVCNSLLYGLLNYTESQKLNTLVGFIHVPYIPQQSHPEMPSMNLDDIVKGIEIAIASISRH